MKKSYFLSTSTTLPLQVFRASNHIDFADENTCKGVQKKSYFRNIGFSLCLILFSFSAFAQTADADRYQFQTNTTATLVDISSGTQNLIGANQSSISSAVTPIGFGFWFMACYYTDFSVNANGILRLGTTQLVTRANTYAIVNNARIAVFSTLDGETNVSLPGVAWRTSATGKVHYKVIGTAPNRILVVEWLNLSLIVDFKNPAHREIDATFQLLIHESQATSSNSGKMEFRYGQMKTTAILTLAVAGFGEGENLKQSKGVDFSSNPPTARSQAGAITNTFVTGTITPLNQSSPNASRTFIFDPPAANTTVSNLKLCQPTPTSIQATWQTSNATSTSNTVYYAIYRSNNGTDYEYLTRVAPPSLSYIDQNLNTGSTYHYRVYAVTEGKLSPLQSTGANNWTLREKLTFDIGSNRTICQGQSVTLDAGAGYDRYRWNTGDSTQKINISPSQTSTYKVSTILGQCTFESNEVEIKVEPPYIISIPPIHYVCKDQSTTIAGLAGYKTYEWYKTDNGTKRVLGTSQALQIGELGELILKVTNTLGCTSTDTTLILGVPAPVYTVTGKFTLCEKDLFAEVRVVLDNTQIPIGDTVSYVWRDEKNAIIGRDPVLRVKAIGIYQITVTNTFGCAVSKFVRITNCCEAKIAVPNAFTPHGTPANNIYRTEHQDLLFFKMSIYTRWGHLVFETTDPKEGWNGRYQGSPMPMDSYQVIITYTSCKEGNFEKKTITQVLHLLE